MLGFPFNMKYLKLSVFVDLWAVGRGLSAMIITGCSDQSTEFKGRGYPYEGYEFEFEGGD